MTVLLQHQNVDVLKLVHAPLTGGPVEDLMSTDACRARHRATALKVRDLHLKRSDLRAAKDDAIRFHLCRPPAQGFSARAADGHSVHGDQRAKRVRVPRKNRGSQGIKVGVILPASAVR